MKNPLMKQILKPLFFLAVLTIICAFLARTLTDSETLSDYAGKKAETQTQTPSSETIQEEPETANEETEPAYEEAETHIDDSKIEIAAQEDDSMTTVDESTDIPADRIIYQEGFYYEPLTDEVKSRITGISYPISSSEAPALDSPAINILAEGAAAAVSYDDLRYLSVLYYDFNGEPQSGELICNKGIAQDLVEIFYELYQNEYQIEKIRLIDEYQGDDTASMADNNTSCFNYRVVDGTTSLSKHALGCAIDINPFYNPYVVFNRGENGETYISPAGSEIYADRSREFPYKIDENDLCYRLFKKHGFVWGGNWNSCKDYQHFQKVLE
ncbi:MAG: M15 family metallopeptidase [Roseburia sp.]|nr:M15 family metallopeptidase [Roseburia sp.]MCM1242979.1 M15 family metallopeptidase [Roseburia sp.]